MKTEVTELLGIEYPIIQGGMAWVAEYHLAAAVSAAGGLGLIGAASAPADWVRQQVREVKKLTDKPFGVNIMLMSPYADEIAQVIVEEKVPVVTTGAGNPEKYMKMWKEAGVKIIPVIAAGGIADGRGIAAAFMLGAKAVQMGTHFVATTECWAHQNYKDMILKAKDIDTKVTGRSTGHPVRALRNQMTKEYLKKEAEGVPFEELEQMTLGSLRRAVVDGDVKMGSVMAGQSAGLVKEQMSCQELIRKLVKETDVLLKGPGIYE